MTLNIIIENMEEAYLLLDLINSEAMNKKQAYRDSKEEHFKKQYNLLVCVANQITEDLASRSVNNIVSTDKRFEKSEFEFFTTYKGYTILQASLNPHNSQYCVQEFGYDIRFESLQHCKLYIIQRIK